MSDTQSDKEIVYRIHGTFATTAEDKHGDQLSPEHLKKWKDQIENNEEVRKLTVGHTDRVVGEILSVEINKKDDTIELIGECGIYEGNKDVEDGVKNGDLDFFSIEAHGYVNTEEEISVLHE